MIRAIASTLLRLFLQHSPISTTIIDGISRAFYRVNFALNNLKPLSSSLAFPHSERSKIFRFKLPSFDGKLMTDFSMRLAKGTSPRWRIDGQVATLKWGKSKSEGIG